MYDASHLSPLPQVGPFALAPGFLRSHALKRALVAMLLVVLGLGGDWHVSNRIREILRVEKTWAEGVAAGGDITIEGKVTTTSFLLPSYDLEVTFSPAEGKPRTVEVEFHRLFGGPEDGDALELRYLATDPDQAVTSWQWDARFHMWTRQVFGFLLFVLFWLAGVLVLAHTVDSVLRVKRLAKFGRLDAVVIVGSKRVGEDIEFEHSAGKSPGTQSFPLDEGGPMMVDGTRALGLLGPDSKRVLLLGTDGWPLAWPPRRP